VETNVFIPAAANDALLRIASESGASRDATVRTVLEAYLDLQRARGESNRLCHVATVLRYPPANLILSRDRGVRLRLRLDEGVAEEAKASALRLPGQASGRAHEDYQARPLADAVLTAIALKARFTDSFLEGLMPLLRQQAAVGLWHLAAAATATGTERELFQQWRDATFFVSPGSDSAAEVTRLESVVELLRDGTIAWHGLWRVEAVRHLARQLLAGADAVKNERMLFDQTVTAFGKLRDDLEFAAGELSHSLHVGMRPAINDVEGRAGAAIWRAKRHLAVQALEESMVEAAECAAGPLSVVAPPGWSLRQPEGWLVLQVGRAPAPLPASWAEAVADHRVIHFQVGSRHLVWPVRRDDAGHVHLVPGMAAALAQLTGLPAVEAVERLLILCEGDEDEGYPRVPAETAVACGLITSARAAALEAAARRETDASIASYLKGLEDEVDPKSYARLVAAANDPTEFTRILARLRIPFAPEPAEYTWRVDSVAAAIEAEAPQPAIGWLTRHALESSRRRLEEAQEEAWHDAFERFRYGNPRGSKPSV
jgi:hypothetical protein